MFVLIGGHGILGLQIEIVCILCVYYFVHLVSNVSCSWLWHRKEKQDKGRRIFAYGMLLFLLCDIHVAIFNTHNYLDVGGAQWYQLVFQIASVAMWFYYLPSQIIIAYSDKKW